MMIYVLVGVIYIAAAQLGSPSLRAIYPYMRQYKLSGRFGALSYFLYTTYKLRKVYKNVFIRHANSLLAATYNNFSLLLIKDIPINNTIINTY